MNIKKFEKYKMELDFSDISTEYAKKIISEFIDSDLNDVSLEEIFYKNGKYGQLEDHDEIIRNTIIDYLEKMLKSAKKLRSLKEIGLDLETKNYNL